MLEVPAFRLETEALYEFYYGFLAMLSFVGPGMNLGYPAIALPSLENGNSTITLTGQTVTLFASLPAIATPLGSIASLATMRGGRRVAIASADVVCTVGWILIACSYNVPQLLVGRILTGFSLGLVSSPGAIYLGEISTTRFTAVLTSCTSTFLSIGIILVYLLGLVMVDWRSVAYASIVVPSLSAISTIFLLPESPRWLLIKKRQDQARKSLLRIRGLKAETDRFRDEFSAMVEYSRDPDVLESSPSDSPNERENGIRKLLTSALNIVRMPEVWKPLLILNAFFILQQFSGIYIVIVYAVDVVTRAGVTLDPYIVTMVIGVVQLLGCIALSCCSTRIGRRPAAIFSGAGMFVSSAALAVYLQFFKSTSLSGIPLACILLFTAAGSFGFMTIPWAMVGELYPTRYANSLGSGVTFLAGLYNFLSIQFYPALVKSNGMAALYSYCGVCFVATIFLLITLPETMGKTKNEIEDSFRNG